MKTPILLLFFTEKENEDYFISLIGDKYKYVTAYTKRSAAETLLDSEYMFDLVITDAILAKEDWIHLQQISYQQRGIGSLPLLSVLNSENKEQIENTLVHENSDVLRKPFIDEVVLHRITNMLKIRRTLNYTNVMEEVVSGEIDRIIDSLDICKCSHCRSDLMILTLNNLPSKYVSTEKGALLSKTDYMSKTNMIPIMTEIAKAAQMVKENPYHK